MARTKAEIEQTGPKDVSEVDVSDVPTNRPADPTLAKAIETAAERLERKAAVLAEVQKSRNLTTLLVDDNLGDREQVAWVRFYLPRKKRKNGEAEDGSTDAGEE